ncbi:MAG: hypothetical protein ACK5MR_14865 [Cumulibacter sp.]
MEHLDKILEEIYEEYDESEIYETYQDYMDFKCNNCGEAPALEECYILEDHFTDDEVKEIKKVINDKR